MADTPIAVHVAENTPEHVALRLFFMIHAGADPKPTGKKEVLDLYAECLSTVKNPATRLTDPRTARR